MPPRRKPSPPVPFTVEMVPVGDLAHHPENYRQGDVGAITESLDRWDWYAPVVVQRSTGHVCVGNHRLDAAIARGDSHVPTVLRDLSDAEARALLAADNRSSDLAVNDEDALARLLAGIAENDPADLLGTGYDGDDVDDLLDRVAAAAGNGNVSPRGSTGDEPPEPEPPKVAHSALGEVYELGPHRLLCGDSTEHPEILAFLDGRVQAMVTDPPYAIYGSASGISSSVSDDGMVRPFFLDILRLAQEATDEYAHAYVCCDWRSWPSWWEMAKRTALEPKNLIVWDKASSGLGNNWANTYELVGYFVHMPPQQTMTSGRRSGMRAVLRPNVLRHNRVMGEERQHNAAKPVALMADLITAATDPGERVLDPFAGSGSTLIACEREGRVCLMVEKDPAYCDVIRARYAAEVGDPSLAPGAEVAA